MASEVNHHVGYSRENECWFVRFYPYQTEQQANEAAAAFTRPAPAATDTGLERYRPEPMSLGGMVRDPDGGYVTRSQAEAVIAELQAKAKDYREYSERLVKRLESEEVTRSQAEELLAAERAEKDGWKELHDAAQLAVKERTEACNNLYKQVNDLKADNAAQAERIKELDSAWSEEFAKRGRAEASEGRALARVATLEAKLAAAEKALEFYADASKWDDGYFKSEDDGTVLRAYPSSVDRDQGDKARAVLGGKPS